MLRRLGSALDFSDHTSNNSNSSSLNSASIYHTEEDIEAQQPHSMTSTFSRRNVLLLVALSLSFVLIYTVWHSAARLDSAVGSSSSSSSSSSAHAFDVVTDVAGFNPNGGSGASGGASGDTNVFRFAVVTDLDFDSKVDQGAGSSYWKSFYREATLTRDAASGRYSVLFDAEKSQQVLRTRLNLDDRAMELSWLAMFDGVLYSGDDRAGVVYSIENGKAAPRFVLGDGDGRVEKGFKSEWGAVKDNLFYIGSFGKEWTNEKGELVNHNPQWIKIIDRRGSIMHVDWSRNYEALRKATGYQYPGYLFHEAAAWNPTLQRWVFVPRRASKERYDAELDETRGTNLIMIADANFNDITMRKINVEMPADGVVPKGYSEIKFVPGHPNDIVALRSMEYKGATKTWISVFNIDGEILMDDVYIDAFKFEGLEFLNH